MPASRPFAAPSKALITMGSAWARFTYAREDIELLGVVQIGMQIGALARLPSGHFAQVNGDFVEHLDAEVIEQAIRRAALSVDGRGNGQSKAPPPTVTIKKRRRIAMEAG